MPQILEAAAGSLAAAITHVRRPVCLPEMGGTPAGAENDTSCGDGTELNTAGA
ncbi:hypothetical protein [Streptomyces cyaneochromogenes]|uniref:hypothetical protein n=1 Tax=Streptomyces cyaneochromogenes TaxID=2496836 RepID=UPI00158A4E88|nr:hypothetical protein [Streptomyces cyaneochromogenes]